MSDSANHVSVIIAAMNAGASVGHAVRTALAEELVAEVIVVDDASRDDTVAMARAADDGTQRLRIVTFDRNRGPGAARNRALDLCTSPYACILDADDYFLPGRIARLLASARGTWDLLADNIVIVPEHLHREGVSLPAPEQGGHPARIDLETFLLGNISRRGRPRGELGFLKPIIRLAFLNECGLRYDEDLRLGEDYALYARALMAGARFFMAGACGYVAIEREASLSSCHSADDLSNLARFDASCLLNADLNSGERRALKTHHAATVKRAVYAKALEVKRERGVGPALDILARQPSCLPHVVVETMRAKGAALLGWSNTRGSGPGVRLLVTPQPRARRDGLTADASSAPRSAYGLDRLRSRRSRAAAVDEFDIAFGIDDDYVPHVGALIASIVHNAPDARFRFVILHAGVPDARRVRVESIAPQARFVWVDVTDDDVPAFASRAHFNRTTLFRLGLEKLAPADCRRILYLDADMIVLRDVRGLFGFELGGAPLGAVADAYLDAGAFRQRWGLRPSELAYFNAGVLLIDLERVRAERLFSAAAAFVAQHDRDLPFNDQDALNWVFWDRWRPLPPSWNAQRGMVVRGLAEGLPKDRRFDERLPDLVHYTGPEKPWGTQGYHPWSWLYWPHLMRTPFFDEIARKEGMGRLQRLRLWLRWLRRRPIETRRMRWRGGPLVGARGGTHALQRS